ncbi:uncharacterized protein MJ1673 [Hydrogenimonas sp.]|nr:uncharacterized protein MJ1673 [Hydrogenimonas sp.]
MRKMIVVFSHTLSEEQKEDARRSLGVENFIFLTEGLRAVWSSISPLADDVRPLLDGIVGFVTHHGRRGDYLLVQGDFGATCYMVEVAYNLDMIPVYAAAWREVEEYEKGGSVVTVRTFRHVRFREYLSTSKNQRSGNG